MWKHWQGIFHNKELYDIMMSEWQVWAEEENQFAQQYKEKKRSVSTKKTVLEDSDSDNEGDDEEFADLYVLSGDSNFKSDHPWAANTTNHGNNYDDELEDESGSEDSDDVGDMTHKQVNALCKKKRKLADSSDDEEEEESPLIKPKKKKVKHRKNTANELLPNLDQILTGTKITSRVFRENIPIDARTPIHASIMTSAVSFISSVFRNRTFNFYVGTSTTNFL